MELKLKCLGMRKTFILSISDCENLQAAFSTENCSNRLSIGAKYNFNNGYPSPK